MWVYVSSPDLHFLVCKMGSGGTVYTIGQNGMLHLAGLAQSSFGPWADSCPVQREQMAGAPQLPGTATTFPATHSECWERSHWSSNWVEAGLLHALGANRSFLALPWGGPKCVQQRPCPLFPHPSLGGCQGTTCPWVPHQLPKQSHHRSFCPRWKQASGSI